MGLIIVKIKKKTFYFINKVKLINVKGNVYFVRID